MRFTIPVTVVLTVTVILGIVPGIGRFIQWNNSESTVYYPGSFLSEPLTHLALMTMGEPVDTINVPATGETIKRRRLLLPNDRLIEDYHVTADEVSVAIRHRVPPSTPATGS